MAFDGYFEFAGTELVNIERVQRYVEHQLPSFPLRRINQCNTLHVALQESPYESPLVDAAPWVSHSDPATHRFFGLYPLSVQGIGDSTSQAAVTQSTVAGGTVGSARDATRSIRIHGILLGADELAVEAGLTWLRAAVRSDKCGMHGDLCGTTDFRYFLACPDVCDPAWGPNVASTATDDLGTLTPADSPVIYRFPKPIDATMPSSVEWVMPYDDGRVIEWGRMAVNDSSILEKRGPVILQRTNYIPNPTFQFDTTGYEMSAGSNIQRVATGGVDDGAYGLSDQDTPPVIRTNWFPNPAFEFEPVEAGWRSNGLMDSVADGTVPHGNNAGRFDRSTVLLGTGYGDSEYGLEGYGSVELAEFGGDGYGQSAYGQEEYGSQDADLYAEITLPGPPVAVPCLLTFSIGDNSPVTITVTDNLGVLIHTQSSPAHAGWEELSVLSDFGRNYTVRFSSAGATFRLNGLKVEVGTALTDGEGFGEGGFGEGEFGGTPGATVGPYFDGDFADVPGSFIDYFYLGDPATTASRRVEGERIPYTVTVAAEESAFGDTVASFGLRSYDSTTVTAQIVSMDDDSVLSELEITPADEWDRYALATPYGRRVKIVLNVTGELHIDQSLVEHSELVWDYFDGSFPVNGEYRYEFFAGPHSSPSRMYWTGSTLIEHPDSDWRPFISAINGEISTLLIRYEIREQIPMDVQLEPYERNYHRVSATAGPTVIRKYQLHPGAAIEVEILLEAGNPASYSNSRPVDMAGITTALFTDPAVVPPVTIDLLLDPDCDPLPARPSPPVIPELCIEDLTDWRRYRVNIEAEDVAEWAGTVLTTSLTSKAAAVRQVRVRLHPNPFNYDAEDVDPNSYCGEFILSYIPPNTTLTVNGMTERAWAQVAGSEPLPASQLLFGTGGSPMVWPELTCGIPYVMTIDIPAANDLDDIEFAVQVNRKE